MYPFCSFLQAICQLVKNMFTPVVKMTKRLYRSAAVIMAGTAVVAVMTFSSAGFAAGGHNALTAYAETSDAHPSGTGPYRRSKTWPVCGPHASPVRPSHAGNPTKAPSSGNYGYQSLFQV